jgi:hypothetical protein
MEKNNEPVNDKSWDEVMDDYMEGASKFAIIAIALIFLGIVGFYFPENVWQIVFSSGFVFLTGAGVFYLATMVIKIYFLVKSIIKRRKGITGKK